MHWNDRQQKVGKCYRAGTFELLRLVKSKSNPRRHEPKRVEQLTPRRQASPWIESRYNQAAVCKALETGTPSVPMGVLLYPGANVQSQQQSWISRVSTWQHLTGTFQKCEVRFGGGFILELTRRADLDNMWNGWSSDLLPVFSTRIAETATVRRKENWQLLLLMLDTDKLVNSRKAMEARFGNRSTSSYRYAWSKA